MQVSLDKRTEKNLSFIMKPVSKPVFLFLTGDLVSIENARPDIYI